MSLTLQQRNRLRIALARKPEVRRTFLIEGGERPLLAFEYDERPATVEVAREQIQGLLALVEPALGSAAATFGFSAGGPDDVGRIAASGEVVYERGAAR